MFNPTTTHTSTTLTKRTTEAGTANVTIANHGGQLKIVAKQVQDRMDLHSLAGGIEDRDVAEEGGVHSRGACELVEAAREVAQGFEGGVGEMFEDLEPEFGGKVEEEGQVGEIGNGGFGGLGVNCDFEVIGVDCAFVVGVIDGVVGSVDGVVGRHGSHGFGSFSFSNACSCGFASKTVRARAFGGSFAFSAGATSFSFDFGNGGFDDAGSSGGRLANVRKCFRDGAKSFPHCQALGAANWLRD